MKYVGCFLILLLSLVVLLPNSGSCMSNQTYVTDQQYIQYQVVPTAYTVRTTTTKRVIARRMLAQPLLTQVVPTQAQVMYNYPSNCGGCYQPNYLPNCGGCYQPNYLPNGGPCSRLNHPACYNGCCDVSYRNNLCNFPLRILDAIFGGGPY